MEKNFNIAVVLAFCIVIFMVPVMTKAEEPVSYSLFENRAMAEVPVYSTEGFLNGNYLPLWDKYFSDQIWRRNDILKTYVELNAVVLNKPVVNTVVMQDHVLLPFVAYSDKAADFSKPLNQTVDNLVYLNLVVEENGGKFLYVGVPEQQSMLRDYYPAYLHNNGEKFSLVEKEFFAALEENNIHHINMRVEFLKLDDYINYYSTSDHHYNMFGAYFTYETVINELNTSQNAGLDMVKADDVEFEAIKNPFYGSRNRKLYNVYESVEQLYFYTQNNPVAFTREDNGTTVTPVVFNLPVNETEPANYGIYMGGDIGETVINTNRGDLPRVLIFGDSFTNPLETILYQSFNEMRSLDLRHYGEMALAEYISLYKPDFVICVRDDTAYLSLEGNGNIR